ncbi:MAG: UvrD-helicase domain-containing protein [Planctomycetota bacterium]
MDGPTPAPSTETLLEGLTEPQRDAVLHTEGPLLVLAGPGSGKTRVITRRIAHLVGIGVPPWSVLALTFTNKAAGEMRERVLDMLGGDPRLTRGLTVTTFHSLCARLLRRYAPEAELPGLKQDFAIYDSADQLSVVKRVLKDLELKSGNWPPRTVLSAISNAKNQLQDAEMFCKTAGDYYSRTIAKVYEGYEKALRAANAVDFDDLLMLTERMLREREAIRTECHSRWRYLLIDEYQDTNHAQFRLATLLAPAADTLDESLTAGLPGIDEDDGSLESKEGDPSTVNICVVGDPDQSIYGWRGADVGNILDFEDRYPGARVITLGENFRSTGPILAVADALIRNNKRRKHKDLFTQLGGGEQVESIRCRDERTESKTVVDWLSEIRQASLSSDEHIEWKDTAVFYRNNSLSRALEDAFRDAGIPYVVARGTAFYEREEVKNALAYLRVVANPADDVSLNRIVNVPTRGLGKTSLQRIQDFATHNALPLFEGLRRSDEIPDLTDRARNSSKRFVELIEGLTGSGTFMGADVATELSDLVERVIRESGLDAMYAKQAEKATRETDEDRLDNLAELVSSAADFEDHYAPEDDPAAFAGADSAKEGTIAETPPLLGMLRAYLERVSLVSDTDRIDPKQGAVTLMTLHAAKGLEFPAVAMVGLEENLLPHSRAQGSDSELEEERRLCFVGITRAMRRLLMTSARYRTIRGVPERTMQSRFLEELPSEHVSHEDRSDDFADDFDSLDQRDDSERSDPFASRSGSMDHYAERFPVGSRVRHPQFGVGEVLKLTPGGYARATVKFAQAGTKTLVLEYARLTRMG